MGLNHSPSIVTNGLVFAYDMGNTQKSFKGEPTTNLLAYSDSLNGGLWSGYCGGTSNVTYKTTDIVAPDGSYNATRLVMDGSTGCGVGASFGLLYGQSAIFTSGQTYTVSIWARCATGTMTMTLGMNDSFGTSITLTTTWQRFSYTATITSNLDRGLQFIRGDSTNGRTFYVWGAQCEQKSFATPYISSPTSSTTRSNTQVVLDQTNNNTVIASSLTYAANNTFSFNGTDSYLDCGSNVLIKPTSAITVSTWIKFTSAASNNRILSDWHQIGVSADRWIFYNDTATTLKWYMTSVGQAEGGTASYTFTPNSWINLVGTYDGINQILYVNGTQFSSVPRTGLMGASTGYTVRIGKQAEAGGAHSGSIGTTTIHNRALSAAEVTQNFNALRGRYGI